MTPSKIFFYLCLSFIFGVFVGSMISIPQSYLLGFLFLGISAFFFKKHRKIAIIGFCLILFSIGAWRYQRVDLNIKNNDLKQYNDQQVILVGKVLIEPDVRENTTQLTVDVGKIVIGKEIVSTFGRILVKANKYPEYNYADVLIIRGLLKTPEEFQDFNYKDYLAKKGIFSLIDWPNIEIIKKGNYSNLWQFGYAQVLEFKNGIRENINQYFSFPQNTLFAAALLGDQSAMPQELKEKLNITGLRHITAISGMNISILCSILMSLLLGFGFWRNQAFYISLIVIFLFVVIIGFQASVVRAGIMGAVFLLGQKVGRLSVSSRAIVITAAIMLFINPMLLRWDVGFQLSFLALLGIIFLTKPLTRLFKFIPQDKFINLRSIIVTTFAAQVFTLPILIYNFGRISLISPLTNVLILPVIYWIMIFGFLFAILGIVYSGFAWILFWPCWFLTAYSEKVINIFSQPWAIKTFGDVHWIWLVIFYVFLAVIIWQVKKKEKLEFLNY